MSHRRMSVAYHAVLALLSATAGCVKNYHVVDVIGDGPMNGTDGADGTVLGDAGDVVVGQDTAMDITGDTIVRNDGAPTDVPIGADLPIVSDAPGCDGSPQCAPAPPIRLVAPLSMSVVDSNSPFFKFNSGSSTTIANAMLSVCGVGMPNCVTQGTGIIGPGINTVSLTSTLNPGVYRWSVMPSNGPMQPSATWEFVVLAQVIPLAVGDGGVIAGGNPGTVSWTGMLDVNLDGHADMVAGSLGASGNMGEAFGFLGGPITGSTITAILGLTNPSPTSGAEFASEVANVGDVDGDGYGDVAIEAAVWGRHRVDLRPVALPNRVPTLGPTRFKSPSRHPQ